MSLPVSDLLLLAGVAVLVFLVARSRPVVMPVPASPVEVLLAQMQTITADRDRWKKEAERLETEVQDLTRDGAVYRRTIQRLNEDCDRRQQQLR